MSKIFLKDVTLVCFAIPGQYDSSINALNFSKQEINFFDTILFTDVYQNINTEINQILIPKFSNVIDWGKFVVFDLYKYINSKFIILIHDDGFIVNPNKWDSEFLNYDYIGAPWPPIYKKNNQIIRVGNSVSLRSKKILELPTLLNLDWKKAEKVNYHEDGFLCYMHADLMKKNGIVYAPFELACKFSREHTLPENINIDPFAFHKWRGKNSQYPCFNRYYQIKKKFSKLKNFF